MHLGTKCMQLVLTFDMGTRNQRIKKTRLRRIPLGVEAWRVCATKSKRTYSRFSRIGN